MEGTVRGYKSLAKIASVSMIKLLDIEDLNE